MIRRTTALIVRLLNLAGPLGATALIFVSHGLANTTNTESTEPKLAVYTSPKFGFRVSYPSCATAIGDEDQPSIRSFFGTSCGTRILGEFPIHLAVLSELSELEGSPKVRKQFDLKECSDCKKISIAKNKVTFGLWHKPVDINFENRLKLTRQPLPIPNMVGEISVRTAPGTLFKYLVRCTGYDVEFSTGLPFRGSETAESKQHLAPPEILTNLVSTFECGSVQGHMPKKRTEKKKKFFRLNKNQSAPTDTPPSPEPIPEPQPEK